MTTKRKVTTEQKRRKVLRELKHLLEMREQEVIGLKEIIGRRDRHIYTLQEEVEKFRKEAEKSRKEDFIWQAQTGPVYPSQMIESHLRNAISYLSRVLIRELSSSPWLQRTRYKVLALSEMLLEAKKRGLDV